MASLPYPRSPLNYLSTEVSGGEEPPTDCTDAHRLGEPTKLFSHRNHRTHRNDWRKIFSHGLHGCTQIRRVWHPCHTHAAHQTIFPQKPQNLTQPNHLWASVKSVGEYFRQSFLWVLRILWENLTQPNHLWASVKSVGEYSSPVVSVNSVNSVGGYALFAWLVHLIQVHPLGGWRGYGRMPYPPTKTPTDCTDVHRLGGKNAT